jgi:hypothetical protein
VYLYLNLHKAAACNKRQLGPMNRIGCGSFPGDHVSVSNVLCYCPSMTLCAVHSLPPPPPSPKMVSGIALSGNGVMYYLWGDINNEKPRKLTGKFKCNIYQEN